MGRSRYLVRVPDHTFDGGLPNSRAWLERNAAIAGKEGKCRAEVPASQKRSAKPTLFAMKRLAVGFFFRGRRRWISEKIRIGRATQRQF
jgi:hypothetical protein